MIERMTDEEFNEVADANLVSHWWLDGHSESMRRLAQEALRAREAEKRLQEEVGRLQSALGAAVGADAEVEQLREDNARLRSDYERLLAQRDREHVEALQLREDTERVAANRAELVGVVSETVAERDAARAEVQRLQAALVSAVQANPDSATERARAEMAEEMRDALAGENGQLRATLAGFVRKAELEERILRERRAAGERFAAPWWPENHACAECVPGGEIVIEGFRCALHAAKDLLGRPEKEKET